MLNFKTPNLKMAAIIGAAAILSACATATPYQQAAKPGASGYSTSQIENDRYTVSFSGNSLTQRETVETYLLFRAAELAVNNGYDYFTVADKNTQEKKRLVSSGVGMGYGFNDPFYSGFACDYDFFNPRRGWRSAYSPYNRSRFSRLRAGYDPFYRSRFSAFGRGYYDPFYDDFNYREITKYKASADIRLHRGAKPNSENAFNAREVMANLGPKVVFPESSS